jgi:hypothetical protein
MVTAEHRASNPVESGRRPLRVRPAIGLLAVVATAAGLLSASCAARHGRPLTIPAPPHASERIGPWDITVAVYDPALFGPERRLGELIGAYRLRLDQNRLIGARLLVNKAQRRLELWVGKRMVKAYRIQLSLNPRGPKTRRGDKRVPEGDYFICSRAPSTFYLGLRISYPNDQDARRGYESGLISGGEFGDIIEAINRRICPPRDTKLGGDILIHGQLPEYTEEVARKQEALPAALPRGLRVGDADPAKIDEFQDWTDGCIALFNPDIRELYEFVPDRTPVSIVANGPVTAPPPAPSFVPDRRE